MSLKKSKIKPSDDAPTADAGMDTKNLIFRLEQRDAYRLILDMKLAPHFPEARPPEPRFTAAQWSPACMYQDHRCIIATLTCTGCLKLYVPYFNCWVEVTDISQFWVKNCKAQWTDKVDEMSSAAEFATLQRRTSQLKITGMVWGNMIKLEQERYSFIATISHYGTLALWKVNHLPDLGIPAQNYYPQLLTTCETNMYNASSLHWMQWSEKQISVIVGDSNGCVTAVTFSFDDINESVSVLNVQQIWKEKDHMKVSGIKSLPHSSICDVKQRILGVTKNSFLLIFLITQEEVASYCHYHLGGLPLTGLEVYNDDSFIVCSLSGVLCKYHVRVEKTKENYKLLTSKNILKTNLSWQDMACFGISKNYNNGLWTLCTNLCKMYDHLVKRRPSQVVFCTISEGGDDIKDSINEIPTKIASSKLRFNWESLEVFRMNYLKELKASPAKEIQFQNDIENMSTTELQMELWRSRILVTHLIMTDTVVGNPEACAYVTLLEELILCRHACKYIHSLLERNKTEPLDQKGLYKLGLLRLWLETWLSHNKPGKTDKNSESKIADFSNNDVPDVNDSVKTINDSIIKMENNFEMDTSEDAQIDAPSSLSGSVVYMNDNVGDNDAASVASFDDAISTDSNSSSVVSEKDVISKRLQIQQGRVPANFLKIKLVATSEQVISTLALPIVPGTLEKEQCAFCEQEVQMDIDWRSGTCPANHRLSRCCHCLSRCHRIPYRLCIVCSSVACLDIDCDLEPFCTFCDSPLFVDEKFKKPGFIPRPQEPTDEEAEDESEEKSEDKSEEKVEDKLEEKVEDKSGEKVEDKSDEKVEDKSDEKVEDKSDEKVEDKSDEKVEDKSEEKVEGKSEEKVEDKPDGKIQDNSEEKVQDKSEEKAKGKSEEKAKGKSEEKAKGKSEEKTKGKSVEKTKGKSVEKTKGKSVEKTKGKSVEKTKGKSEEKTKGKSEEKTKGKSEEKAKGKSEEKAKGKSEEKTKGKSEEKTKGKSEEKTKGKSEEKTKGKSEEKTKGKSEEKTKGKSEEKTKGKSEEKTKGKSEEKTKGKSEEKTKGKSEEKAKSKSEKKAKDKTEKKVKGKSEEKIKDKSEEKATDKSKEKAEDKVEKMVKAKSGGNGEKIKEKTKEGKNEQKTEEQMECEESICVTTENLSAISDVPMDTDI
ncbi:hypothetical protein R5R35_005688 [Gryllus longicercus]